MSVVLRSLDIGVKADSLRSAFLFWQCRVRQIAMRENKGRPDSAIIAALTLSGETQPMGHVITVLSKAPAYSKTPEMKHIVASTRDPAQRREKALELFSETYYQIAREFSDILTATFPPSSPGSAAICVAENCTLTFESYGQRFDLYCKVSALSEEDPLFQTSWFHNLLFNPNLHPKAVILCFEPDWDCSSAESAI